MAPADRGTALFIETPGPVIDTQTDGWKVIVPMLATWKTGLEGIIAKPEYSQEGVQRKQPPQVTQPQEL